MSSSRSTHFLAIAGLCGGLAAGFAGCAGGGETASQEPAIDLAAEEAAVRQVNMDWLDLFRARDAAGISALFLEDGFTLGDEGLRDGRAAILADMTADFEEYPDATADWGAKQVWVAASGDLAVERGWWSYDPDGAGAAEGDEGEYVTVLRKIDGNWMIVADVGASTMPNDEDDGGDDEM